MRRNNLPTKEPNRTKAPYSMINGDPTRNRLLAAPEGIEITPPGALGSYSFSKSAVQAIKMQERNFSPKKDGCMHQLRERSVFYRSGPR